MPVHPCEVIFETLKGAMGAISAIESCNDQVYPSVMSDGAKVGAALMVEDHGI